MRKYIILLLLVLMSSCESFLFDDELCTEDPLTNFEYLWKKCDEQYAYFEVKEVDWEKIYDKYVIRINSEMTDQELFDVLDQMLGELRDDHVGLQSCFNKSKPERFLNSQDNFDWRVIKDNYLQYDYQRTGSIIHDFLCEQRIGYIRIPQFTASMNNTQLDYILERYRQTKGIIIDIRENPGGNTKAVFGLMARLVEQKTLLYYSRTKSGKNHNEFSEPKPATVEPYDGICYTGKVMFLVDRGTYSAGSFASLATKAIPNILLVGDTTGGGLGMPVGAQLPNGWNYEFPVTQALNLNMKPDWENGVPADVLINIDWSDRSHDEIIDRAIDLILNQTL